MNISLSRESRKEQTFKLLPRGADLTLCTFAVVAVVDNSNYSEAVAATALQKGVQPPMRMPTQRNVTQIQYTMGNKVG